VTRAVWVGIVVILTAVELDEVGRAVAIFRVGVVWLGVALVEVLDTLLEVDEDETVDEDDEEEVEED
jgi:hypothetical protein